MVRKNTDNAIEMFTIPKDYIKPFFGIVKEFRDDIELLVDKNKVYYSIADTGKCCMVCSKLFIPTTSTTTFQIELDPLLKVVDKDITYYMTNNMMLYKTENGKHMIGTLTDPRIKESLKDLPSSLPFKAQLYIEKEKMSAFIMEVLNIVKSSPDEPLTFTVEDNALIVNGTIEDQYHEFEFNNIENIEGENCKSHFDVRYLVNATKYYKHFDSIKLLLGTNIPCQFEYRGDVIHTDILIAPRILDD